MKRLDTLTQPVPPESYSYSDKIYEFRIERSTDPRTPLETFSPLHYEPGYAYPLIVWLHGSGDNETQLRRVMPVASSRNFVAVAPRGTRKSARHSARFPVHCWSQRPGEIERAAQAVSAAIESARENYNIHERRIFLAGYRDGGTMALRLALQNPAAYAGVVSINGGLPEGSSPLRGLPAIRDLRMLVMQCQQGTDYPEAQLCNDIRLAHSAAFKMDVRQYLCEDAIMTDMLQDMNSWVMGRVLE
ncbi:MAG: PHB depolymerase family esterase [Pirellulaceae bacterium]